MICRSPCRLSKALKLKKYYFFPLAVVSIKNIINLTCFFFSVKFSASILASRVSRWAMPAGSCTVWSTEFSQMVRCLAISALVEATIRSTRSSVKPVLGNTSRGQFSSTSNLQLLVGALHLISYRIIISF